MSISKRDQRITIAQERDIGTSGRIQLVYAATALCWGRIEAPTGSTHALGTQLEHTADAVISVSRTVSVPQNGMVIGPDGTWYRITAVLDRRALSERQIMAVYADDADLTVLYPGTLALAIMMGFDGQGSELFADDSALAPQVNAAGLGGQLFTLRDWYSAVGVLMPKVQLGGSGGMVIGGGDAEIIAAAELAIEGSQIFILREWFSGQGTISTAPQLASTGGMLMTGDGIAGESLDTAAIGGELFVLSG